MTTNTAAVKQTFDVFATLKSVISVKVEASSYEEAMAIAQYQLHDINILKGDTTLVRVNGDVVKSKMHDWDIDVEEAFED